MLPFVASGCTCKHGKGKKPCHTQFTATQYRHSRDECRDLARDELDLVIMGQLQALTKRDTLTQKERAMNKDRVQTSTVYQFGGHKVCFKTFCFLHSIGKSILDALKKSWMENGLRPCKRSPWNATKLTDIENVVRFVNHYAENNAILLPGRIPGYKRDDIQLLPSSITKREVWQLYQQSATEMEGTKAVCYSLFCRLWRQLTPHVVITKPMSDLCWTCQKNSTMIMRSHNQPVEEKSEVIHRPHKQCMFHIIKIPLQALHKAEEHLLLVTQERSAYKQEVEQSRRHVKAHFTQEGVFVSPPPHGMIAPASNAITVHYSFDFAQQVHYPSNPLQPGPIYFLTPRKAAIIGICCEAIP